MTSEIVGELPPRARSSPGARTSMALNLALRTAYHMKYSVANCGILKTFHI